MFKMKNKTIFSLNILSGIIIFFGLTMCLQSCAGTKSFKDESSITLSSVDDPDGDGDNKGADYFPLVRMPTGNKVFIFDPNFVAWAIYDAHGKRLNTGKASGGKTYCPDVARRCTTISGEFRVMSKGGANCVSSKYPLETHGGAPMPYCMFFNANGYGIHGSGDVPDHNASHGCIRVTPVVAKWLNQNFMEIGTTVIVYPYQK